jgi:hypothetical protein
VDEYAHVAAEAERPKRLADHRDAWEGLTPLLGVNGSIRERVEAFCAEKRISLEALIALRTRVRVDDRGGVELAWGYEHNGAVTAVKVRPLGDKRRYALAPSVFLQPLVIGRRDSLNWMVAEGETDAARLFDLVGDTAAILVLPAGAKAFKQQWAAVIPRGATVGLAHDADEAGDAGAEKTARVIGGRTVRIRPPVEGGDWCDWEGGREEFLALVRAARSDEETQSLHVAPVDTSLRSTSPQPNRCSATSATPFCRPAGRWSSTETAAPARRRWKSISSFTWPPASTGSGCPFLAPSKCS